MTEHLHNVQQEIAYAQTRVEAKRKELDTEEHLKALGQREVSSNIYITHQQQP